VKLVGVDEEGFELLGAYVGAGHSPTEWQEPEQARVKALTLSLLKHELVVQPESAASQEAQV
jgi:hypothetical protein